MLTKETVVDKIEVLETGHVQVRRATYILEDGIRISNPIYHRSAYSPGDSVLNEDSRVTNICNTVWTTEVIEAYKTKVKAT